MDKETNEKFNVFKFYEGEFWRQDGSQLDAEAAVLQAKKITDNAANETDPGPVVRVIITDRDDSTVFEWKAGEGVVYPPQS